MRTFFKKLPSCFLVRGYCRSAIIDTQRKDLYTIPNSMEYIISNYHNKSIEWIKNHYSNNPIINDYFNFLIDNQLIYITSELSELSKLKDIDISFEKTSLIDNCIVEIDSFSDHNFSTVIYELNLLNCIALEIRVLSLISIDQIYEILQNTNDSTIRTVVLYLPFEINLNYIKLLSTFPRVTSIFFYNSPNNKVIHHTSRSLFFIKQNSICKNECGNINPKFFSLDINTVLESMYYNNCLNAKISISANGDIKNCPAADKVYGNIASSKISEIATSEKFKKLWSITKDMIDECKDCEFRYICVDCRSIVKNKHNVFSKPLKCKYNPYKAEWVQPSSVSVL